MSPPISATCDGDGPAAGGMTAFRSLDDIEVAGKRVLVRVDLNVPMREGAVGDATRIDRVAPTLSELAERGARVIVASHFGRPQGQARGGDVAEPPRRTAFACTRRPPGTLRLRLHRRWDGGRRGCARTRRCRAAGEPALPPWRGGERSRLRRCSRGARRSLRQRCVLGCPSRPRLHHRRGGAPAERGGAPHAGRAGGARQGVAGARAAGRRRRRRRQGLDQTRDPCQSDPPGRPPRHRRRHGQHVPSCARGRRRRVAPRARPGGRCAPASWRRRREPGARSCCPPTWR